jgi:hypothetical protein
MRLPELDQFLAIADQAFVDLKKLLQGHPKELQLLRCISETYEELKEATKPPEEPIWERMNSTRFKQAPLNHPRLLRPLQWSAYCKGCRKRLIGGLDNGYWMPELQWVTCEEHLSWWYTTEGYEEFQPTPLGYRRVLLHYKQENYNNLLKLVKKAGVEEPRLFFDLAVKNLAKKLSEEEDSNG